MIGQPTDIETLEKQAFSTLMAVGTSVNFGGLKINRTAGHHGTGEIEKMGWSLASYLPEYGIRQSAEKVFSPGPASMHNSDVVRRNIFFEIR